MIHVVMQLCGCDKSQACIAHGLHTTLPGSEPPKALEQLLSQSRCKASPNWICIAICMLSANRTLVNRLQCAVPFLHRRIALLGTVRLSQALFDLHLLVRAADALAAKSKQLISPNLS